MSWKVWEKWLVCGLAIFQWKNSSISAGMSGVKSLLAAMVIGQLMDIKLLFREWEWEGGLLPM